MAVNISAVPDVLLSVIFSFLCPKITISQYPTSISWDPSKPWEDQSHDDEILSEGQDELPELSKSISLSLFPSPAFAPLLLVNKRWFSTVLHTIQALKVPIEHLAQIPVHFKVLPRLQSAEFIMTSHSTKQHLRDVFRWLSFEAPNLAHLSFSSSSSATMGSQLTMSNAHYWASLIPSLPRLRSFSSQGLRDGLVDLLLAAKFKMPNLQRLHLESPAVITKNLVSCIRSILSDCTRLVDLSIIVGSFSDLDGDLFPYPPQLVSPILRRFSLPKLHFPSPPVAGFSPSKQLHRILTAFPALTHLAIGSFVSREIEETYFALKATGSSSFADESDLLSSSMSIPYRSPFAYLQHFDVSASLRSLQGPCSYLLAKVKSLSITNLEMEDVTCALMMMDELESLCWSVSQGMFTAHEPIETLCSTRLSTGKSFSRVRNLCLDFRGFEIEAERNLFAVIFGHILTNVEVLEMRLDTLTARSMTDLWFVLLPLRKLHTIRFSNLAPKALVFDRPQLLEATLRVMFSSCPQLRVIETFGNKQYLRSDYSFE